jgi:hypothetical protein
MSHPTLPTLQKGQVDSALFARYIDELQRHAAIQQVQIKSGARSQCQAGPVDLSTAGEAMQAGTARGMQVVYRYEDRSWIDTVLAEHGVFRIIRLDAS